MTNSPEFLKSGAPARLFPVLSITSKEGRTTSIVLACMVLIRELSEELLSSVGQKLGKRSTLRAFTEVVFDDEKHSNDRPDGLLILTNGKSQWAALIETKVAKAQLSVEQVERYRQIARTYNLDCVITISNQFASSPDHHPLVQHLNKRLKVPVFHWSWMYILTLVDLLYSNDSIQDADQKSLLNELRRFLSHESAGVEGFHKMPPQWTELVRLVSSGGKVLKTSDEANVVLGAWHQETRDLSLVMTRKLDTLVSERFSRKEAKDPAERFKAGLQRLCDDNELASSLGVPDAVAPIEITANLSTRSINISMTLRAPEDRKSSKARLNWLLRQLPDDLADHFFVRFLWPGRAQSTQVSISEAKKNPDVIDKDRSHLQVLAFEVLAVHKLGARFGQQANFISDLEAFVPQYYEAIGQNLSEWKKPAPRLKDEDVSIAEISDDANAAVTSPD